MIKALEITALYAMCVGLPALFLLLAVVQLRPEKKVYILEE